MKNVLGCIPREFHLMYFYLHLTLSLQDSLPWRHSKRVMTFVLNYPLTSYYLIAAFPAKMSISVLMGQGCHCRIYGLGSLKQILVFLQSRRLEFKIKVLAGFKCVGAISDVLVSLLHHSGHKAIHPIRSGSPIL